MEVLSVVVPTDYADLVGNALLALEPLLESCPAGSRCELQLSTALTTNTIVEERETPTAVVDPRTRSHASANMA